MKKSVVGVKRKLLSESFPDSKAAQDCNLVAHKKLAYKIKSVEELADLISGLSKERFQLLKLIKELNPGSIYQLASMAGKSQPYVQKEVRYLAELGLVSFKKQRADGRLKMVPVVAYSSLSIEISL